MAKRAIIFDLDNTIYSVRSIGDELFASLFDMIGQSGEQKGNLSDVKNEIMRKPFQRVAKDFNLSEELTKRAIAHLKDLTYDGNIEPFADYYFAKRLPVDKYLVTAGFVNLQQSKITRLKLESDFREIHIIDPSTSNATKKDVFADILKSHGYAISEILVVGDDAYSEIKAAQDLGIDAVLYDKFNEHADITSIPKISNFEQLNSFLF